MNHEYGQHLRVIAAFSDKHSYDLAYELFEYKGNKYEHWIDHQTEIGVPCSAPPMETETECILISRETKKIEKLEQPYCYNPYE